LARRVSHARAAGLQVTTLVPRAATIERHIDLVVKQQITAISGVGTLHKSPRHFPAPRALHYGVWELPVNHTLPARQRWGWFADWALWRQIRRAASEAATFHLVIDAPRLLTDGGRGLKTVARLLRRAAELRNRGFIQVETLRTAAARLANVPPLSPHRSILRRAA
jgi:hypothetical protein